MKNEHIPVLLHGAVEALVTRPDGIYVDATFGRGGHSQNILNKLNSKGRLFAFDKDPEATSALSQDCFQDPRFCFKEGSFTGMEKILLEEGLQQHLDGILIDLGVSSPQLDNPIRGFSFQSQGPLDMRMNPNEGVSLGEWLQSADEKEISWVLKHYGEERYSHRIAKNIKKAIMQGENLNTKSLSELIAQSIPYEKNKNPATRSFLAFRIFINQELEQLKTLLHQSTLALKMKGRLVVISFHSLEDRIVKHFMKGQYIPTYGQKWIPNPTTQIPFQTIGKAIKASTEEIKSNPRARSAIMRIAEKIL